MRTVLLLPALLVIGCTGKGPTSTYEGYTISDFFPLDGTRTWEYAQDDENNASRVDVVKVPQTLQVEDIEIVTLEYSDKATGDLLYSIDWSSDSTNGVLIHGYTDEATSTTVSYDPPVTFGSRKMNVAETASTDTDHGSFVSTYEATVDCPNFWRDDWQCLEFTVDDGDGDDSVGPPFTGTWDIATSYGASRFRPPGYDTDWVLATASFASEE